MRAHSAQTTDEDSSYSVDATDRFRAVFQREPTTRDLRVHQQSRTALLLRLPAQARRRAARVITSW